MAKVSKNRTIVFVSVAVFFLVLIVWALFYAITPPGLLANRKHVLNHESAFDEIVALIQNDVEIQRVSLTPDNTLEFSVIRQGTTVDFTADKIDRIVELFLTARVTSVDRGEGGYTFYGGSERRLGKEFQVRVLIMRGLRDAVVSADRSSCISVDILVEERGECVDVLLPDWAIHYLWLD